VPLGGYEYSESERVNQKSGECIRIQNMQN
jgi:hypothetical protein